MSRKCCGIHNGLPCDSSSLALGSRAGDQEQTFSLTAQVGDVATLIAPRCPLYTAENNGFLQGPCNWFDGSVGVKDPIILLKPAGVA